jgi:hypothetical protein
MVVKLKSLIRHQGEGVLVRDQDASAQWAVLTISLRHIATMRGSHTVAALVNLVVPRTLADD